MIRIIIILILFHLVFAFSKRPDKKRYGESRKDFAKRWTVYWAKVLISLPLLAYFV